MKAIILCILLVPLLASAQVRKCVDATGKTIYSDVLCDTTAKQTIVDTSRNTIDHSGLREQAAKDKAQAVAAAGQEKAAKAKRGGKPGPCDGILSIDHAPSERQKSEYQRCTDKQVREYNRSTY